MFLWLCLASRVNISFQKINVARFVLPPLDGTASFKINSNTSYNITTSQTWLKSDASSVSGNSTVTVTAEPNPTIDARTAYITITTSASSPKKVDVDAAPQQKTLRTTTKSTALSTITQTITVTQPGNTSTSIPSPQNSCLSIYPNPTTKGFEVSFNGESVILTIVNMRGETLLSQKVANKEYIDITNLKSGIYIVSIGGQRVKLTKK